MESKMVEMAKEIFIKRVSQQNGLTQRAVEREAKEAIQFAALFYIEVEDLEKKANGY